MRLLTRLVYASTLLLCVQGLSFNISNHSIASTASHIWSGSDCHHCVLYAGTVQVLYFPESNLTTSPGRLVTAILSGYTLYVIMMVAFRFLTNFYCSTSPSVYVAYKSIAAGGNLAGEVCPQHIGSVFADITRSCPPNYLMTRPGDCGYHNFGRAWSKLRIRDLMNLPQNWISAQGCVWQFDDGVGVGPLGSLSPNGTEMAASPALSYPPDISTLDPLWVGCSADAYNWAYDDPPRALTPVSASLGITDILAPQDTPSPQLGSVDPAPGDVATTTRPVKTAGAGRAKPLPPCTTSDMERKDPPSKTISPQGPARDSDGPSIVFPDSPSQGPVTPKPTRHSNAQPYTPNAHAADPHRASFVGTSASQPPQIDGEDVRLGADSAILIGDLTVKLGQQTTIGGKHVSVGPGEVYLDGVAYDVSSKGSPSAPATTIELPYIDGKLIRIGTDGKIIVGDATMTPGEQTTIRGTFMSVGQGTVVVGNHTYHVALPTSSLSSPGDARITNLGGQPSSERGPDIMVVSGTTYVADRSPLSVGHLKADETTAEHPGAAKTSSFGQVPLQTATVSAAANSIASTIATNVTGASSGSNAENDAKGMHTISMPIFMAVTAFSVLLLIV